MIVLDVKKTKIQVNLENLYFQILFKKKIICSQCAFLFGVSYETLHLHIDNFQLE